jgi:RNA polymerase sigma-70 factor (ECF subfamily)
VLILREVLHWHATEVAELLDTSVASVNSALQRARATMASHTAEGADIAALPADSDPAARALLDRYVAAFESYDIPAIVKLLREDAIQSMPPFAMWIRGAESIGRWMLGPGIGCLGSRLLPTAANGCPAFAQYRVDPKGGHTPWGLHVLHVSGGQVAELTVFIDVDATLFRFFGLPTHLDELPTLDQ